MTRPHTVQGYEDWPDALANGVFAPADPVAARVAALLGVPQPTPVTPRVVRRWDDGGPGDDPLVGTEIEWRTGFGPPTRAWVVRPREQGTLPGVLALHCHGGVKSVGGERLVRTDRPSPGAERRRTEHYEGRALVNDLARRGHVVLVHDAFTWGSRRVRLDPEPWRLRAVMDVQRAAWAAAGHVPDDDEAYDVAAAHHEDAVAKVAGWIGTSFAGTVAHDDLVALDVLAALPGVDAARLGVVGFSGGGGRAATLTALDERVRASAVVCMMATAASMTPAHVDAHSWLLATPGLAPALDLPDLAAARGTHHQLVLSALDDPLFPRDGILAAHDRLEELFTGATGTYEGALVPGGHVFTRAMQEHLGTFLRETLGAPSARCQEERRAAQE
ncbi:acetyl xylan esterase AXE1 [Sediminihabitans luteus]|uniref:Acetyl xylan esterase AXE1 n=1 Tax=Sediminihabitans luteus TaxID=1138585 RepID=A0A2M9CPV3_9CELL|nr:acetylxylan esterase [Sediminihabitans luteus]PJJ73942.1 acetyl xylan esterase AXE1 [Sediminihabitans luteus]GII98145.1 hypothetical protein Slu03_05230 [Sediminihabitans luteus]